MSAADELAGLWIRYRTERGLTFLELAARLGVDPSTVHGYCDGAPIRDDLQPRVAALLEVPPDWLAHLVGQARRERKALRKLQQDRSGATPPPARRKPRRIA